MTLPAVTLTESDGALSSLPSGAEYVAVCGVTSTGTEDTPTIVTRSTDLADVFGIGPGVELGALAIQQYGRPIIFVKTGDTTAGSYPGSSTVTTTGAGTSAVTAHTSGTEPADDYEIFIEIVLGGTIGTGPITLRYSRDGGRTMSGDVSLGVATNYVIPGTGGARVDFAAGTTLTGETISFVTKAPVWDGSDIASAVAALGLSSLPWSTLLVSGDLTGTLFDALETAFAGFTDKLWLGHFRMPNVAESDATYTAAFNTAFSAKATTVGGIAAGAAQITSARSFEKFRRPSGFVSLPRIASLQEHQDAADLAHGALRGVAIRDANGNVVEHDERANPGLDDYRAITLRTWDRVQGIYITNPKLLSASGSDFRYVQHRRVMNLFKRTLDAYLTRRLSKPIRVSATTGFILEADALEIEAGADAVCRAVLAAAPKVSGGGVVLGRPDRYLKLSRTDDLLATDGTLTGQGAIIPLAYPKAIAIDIGFRNPQTQVV